MECVVGGVLGVCSGDYGSGVCSGGVLWGLWRWGV